jgi:hypothetical protein
MTLQEPLVRKVFLLIFTPVGLVLMARGSYLSYLAWVSNTWPSVEGVIVQSKLVPDGHLGKTATAKIEFAYSVDGVEYVSDQYRFGAVGQYTTPHAIERELSKYPIGTKVMVSYDPAEPQNAVIERGQAFSAIADFLTIGVIITGVPLILYFHAIKDKVLYFLHSRLFVQR